MLFFPFSSVFQLTVGVIHNFAAENVKYLELRSTPKEIPHTGMTRELYVRTMLRAIHDCEAENLDIVVYLLLSIDRRNSVKVAQLTVDLAEKFREETEGVVIGIDFSGDPAVRRFLFMVMVLLITTHVRTVLSSVWVNLKTKWKRVALCVKLVVHYIWVALPKTDQLCDRSGKKSNYIIL